MRQRMAASISAIVVMLSIVGIVQEKLTATEGGSVLMAVLAYWAEPPASPGTG